MSPGMPYVGNPDAGVAEDAGTKNVAVLNMRIVGANPAAKIAASNRLESTSNYFIGNNSAKWRTGVANFGKVRYSGIYAGVDLVYYGNQNQLEYDFVVAPGANPDVITMQYTGGPDGRGESFGQHRRSG